MSEQPIANELREIVDWSANQPMWQRDALRRLLQQRGLDDDDISELLLICRATRGIRDANEPAPAFFPAESSSLPESEAERNAVSLRAVRNVQRVNALAENQTLKFRHDGLTVVFGHNGSGKSGYARILRDACRARANDTILPNVYDMPCMDAATAEIEFQVAGERQNIVWEAGVATVDALGLVSFFDSEGVFS